MAESIASKTRDCRSYLSAISWYASSARLQSVTLASTIKMWVGVFVFIAWTQRLVMNKGIGLGLYGLLELRTNGFSFEPLPAPFDRSTEN